MFEHQESSSSKSNQHSTKIMSKPLNIFIYSQDGAGHLNACIGIGQALANRGHRITFLLNEAYSGQFHKYGFGEILLSETKTNTKSEPVPFKVMAQHLLASGWFSNKSSLEKMIIMKESALWKDFYDKIVQFNPQIERELELGKPDFVLIDHYLIPPAILKSNIPYILVVSGNPLLIYNSNILPPNCSGYPTEGDPETWVEFQKVFESFLDFLTENQQKLNAQFNFVPTIEPSAGQYQTSPYLNVYGFPEELDYQDRITIPENIVRVDAFLRDEGAEFELPEGFRKDHKLIYVSLGSMASIDVDLMKRIVAVCGQMDHKFIVSKGPRGDEYELPDNCWGANFLPQTKILPIVDLVITHGGNNTITETFSFGKPMIVLPLFADQYDNAQRVQEKGYGLRLEAYDFTDQQLREAIDQLLTNEEINRKCQIASSRIKQSNSKEKVCVKIEQMIQKFKN